MFVHQFDDDGAAPNNPSLPLIIYRRALLLPGQTPDIFIKRLFARNHWRPCQPADLLVRHCHSMAHETLAVVCGSAMLQLGGPLGIIHGLRAGDVAIIPAGVTHQRLGGSDDFVSISAFPAGQALDFCCGRPGERPRADRSIARVALPKADPVYGADGPLLELWAAEINSRCF